MGQTGRTVKHNPGVSREPGFFENRRRSVLQTLAVGEGDDFVKIAVRITKEAGYLASINTGQVTHVTDAFPTGFAEKKSAFFLKSLLGLLKLLCFGEA